MYLPPHFGFAVPGADGRATASSAVDIATNLTRLFNNIHNVFTTWVGGGDGGAHLVVESNVGAGTWHTVTAIEVGRVIDTMRSRRSSLDENYQVSTVIPTWT
jgi:sulfite reductase beta subunit-like hemoprotein